MNLSAPKILENVFHEQHNLTEHYGFIARSHKVYIVKRNKKHR